MIYFHVLYILYENVENQEERKKNLLIFIQQGDSGGPLFTTDSSNGKVIIGVASHSAAGACGTAGAVAYYTTVFPYILFITNAANNRVDSSMVSQSYKNNPDYQQILKENKYRYNWIYVPDVATQSRYPVNNAP